MSVISGFRQARTILPLMAVVVLFLGIAAAFLVVRQKDFLLEQEKKHAEKEMELIGTLAREALIKRDYATVEQFFNSWGMDNPDIVSIEAVAYNGFTLAFYKRNNGAEQTYEASRNISYSGRKLISMKMVKDFSSVDEIMRSMLLKSTVALLFFALPIGAALCYAMRRKAMLLMETAGDNFR